MTDRSRGQGLGSLCPRNCVTAGTASGGGGNERGTFDYDRIPEYLPAPIKEDASAASCRSRKFRMHGKWNVRAGNAETRKWNEDISAFRSGHQECPGRT